MRGDTILGRSEIFGPGRRSVMIEERPTLLALVDAWIGGEVP